MSLVPIIPPAAISPSAVAPSPLPMAGDQIGNATSFAQLFANGLQSMEQKVTRADDMVKSFALGESIPIHQVTIALEEARLAVELVMQMRSRLLEGYRELMNMQL